ncbi:F-box and leucine-rich repeat protein 4, partial [Cichlidogyrus casuarinus]
MSALQLGNKDSGRNSPEEETGVQYPTENPLLSDQNLSYKQCLRRLDLSWCGAYEKISPCIFGRFLADACTQLSTLRLASCPFVDDECLLLIANKCRLLQELDLSSCLNVTHKGLDVLARLLNLRWLSLYRVPVNDITLNVFASLWTKLEHLNLGSSCSPSSSRIADALVQLCEQNPSLCSLNLWRWDVLTSEQLMSIARLCPRLQEIDLGWCRLISNEAVLELCRCCPRMKKLFLTAVRPVNAQSFESIANLLGDLEQLDLLGNSQMTLHNATLIVSKCTKLRFFELSWCSSITEDELNGLRLQYPRCFFQKSNKPYSRVIRMPQLPTSNSGLVLALGP